METPEKKLKKNNWIGLVPVLILALGILLFCKTEDLRKKQEEQREKTQYQTIMQEADTFAKIKTDKKAVEALLEQSGYGDICLKQIFEAKNKEKQAVGTVYELCSKSGYGGDLTLLVGLNESDAICGIMVKEAPEMVETVIKEELASFLEQFLYSRKDKVFWMEERVFGGTEIVKMDCAPVTSREIVRIVNSCRLLENNRDTLAGGQSND